MMSDSRMFSDLLAEIAELFRPAADARESVEMDAESVRGLYARLHTMQRLYANVAQELEILRLTEAGRMGRKVVEELATSQACELIVDPLGKVIRPDFGRRS